MGKVLEGWRWWRRATIFYQVSEQRSRKTLTLRVLHYCSNSVLGKGNLRCLLAVANHIQDRIQTFSKLFIFEMAMLQTPSAVTSHMIFFRIHCILFILILCILTYIFHYYNFMQSKRNRQNLKAFQGRSCDPYMDVRVGTRDIHFPRLMSVVCL